MRKALILGLFLALRAAAPASGAAAAGPARERVARYFEAWYSVCPATKVTVTPVSAIRLAGYETFQVERACDLKNRNEMSIVLVDTARQEVFVGEVLHDDSRRGRPFSPAQDVPVLQGALTDVYGLPVTLEVLPGKPRSPETDPSLDPADRERLGHARRVRFRGRRVAADRRVPAARRRAGGPPEADPRRVAGACGRRRARTSSRPSSTSSASAAACATPELRDYAFTHGGGALEIRFLPLVKVHEWSFAAAETAAALANVSPALYLRYEDALFPKASSMTPAAARQLGADLAEAAGVCPAFAAELSSGRARQRVVKDIELAMRLGLNGTPVFFYEGVFLTSEPGVAEGVIGGSGSGR